MVPVGRHPCHIDFGSIAPTLHLTIDGWTPQERYIGSLQIHHMQTAQIPCTNRYRRAFLTSQASLIVAGSLGRCLSMLVSTSRR